MESNKSRATEVPGSWSYHGGAFPKDTPSKGAQSLAVHRNVLWMIFVDKDRNPCYSCNSGSTWSAPAPLLFTEHGDGGSGDIFEGGCALAEFNGTLHAMLITREIQLVHFQYDDNTSSWGKRTNTGLFSDGQHALCAFDGRLFCGYQETGSSHLLYSTWDNDNGWARTASANDESTGGVPGLFKLKGELRMVFSESDAHHNIDTLLWNPTSSTWQRTTAPKITTAYGCSATSDTHYAYMATQEKDVSNHGEDIVTRWNGTVADWETILAPEQRSQHNPAVAVYDNTLYMVFNARNDTNTILWSTYTIPEAWYKLGTWMGDLGPSFYDKYVSELTIPGTHDSCAVTTFPFAGTQNLYIPEQLDAGIRYFDLRAKLTDGDLYMYHGPTALHDQWGNRLKLSVVLGSMIVWLQAAGHEKEGIFTQISDEAGPGSHDFANAVRKLLASDPVAPWFRLDNTIPKLRDVQRKIQLIRRYPDTPAGAGIDLTGWKNDSREFTINLPNGRAIVQDNYNISDPIFSIAVSGKMKDIKNLMEQARNTADPSSWFINFTSATAVPFYDPYIIAAGLSHESGVNKRVEEYIYSKTRPARLGTVLMDIPQVPSYDHIALLITCNRVR
ncbi:hypothetical protein AA313_de0209074 [Arthrobotrys entomopaga]|nr:hypothetical protein AA313_de0209074 [Arthrobotrys entomopaga]